MSRAKRNRKLKSARRRNRRLARILMRMAEVVRTPVEERRTLARPAKVRPAPGHHATSVSPRPGAGQTGNSFAGVGASAASAASRSRRRRLHPTHPPRRTPT